MKPCPNQVIPRSPHPTRRRLFVTAGAVAFASFASTTGSARSSARAIDFTTHVPVEESASDTPDTDSDTGSDSIGDSKADPTTDYGVLNGCHAALAHMIAQGHGSIVTVGSLSSILGLPKQATWTNKAAVLNLTRTIAAEASPYGVRANAVSPVSTETQILEQYLETQGDPDVTREAIAGQYPIRRLGEPEEIANAICFVASDESSFVSGHSLVDGGFSTC